MLAKRLKRLIGRYIYSDDLPLDARNINIICFVGFCAASLLFIVRLIIGVSPLLVGMAAAMAVVIVILASVCNRFKLYRLCSWIVVVIMCYILFPLVFFLFGGIDGDTIVFFVLSTVVIFMLMRGIGLLLALLVQIIVVWACFLIGYWYPDTILSLAPEQRLVDSILSFMVVSVTIGVIVYFQQGLFFNERSKLIASKEALERHDRLLGVTNDVAATLLSDTSPGLSGTMNIVMSMLTKAYAVDRMYVWRDVIQDDVEVSLQVYEWPPENATDYRTVKSQTQANVYTWAPTWKQTLRQGKVINGPISNDEVGAGMHLERFDIKSIVVVPIFLHQGLWGYISLDDCQKVRTFSEDEVSILQSISLMVASAINRTQSNLALANRLEQQELMAAVSSSFVSGGDMGELVRNALRQVGEFMGVSRVLIAAANQGGDESYPRYSWFASEKWIRKALQEEFNAFWEEVFPKNASPGSKVSAIYCNNSETDEDGRYRAFLDQMSLKSFIWAPVYVEGVYWGTLSIEECRQFREWSGSDKQLVGAVTSAIMGAITRDLMDQARVDALETAVRASQAKSEFLSNMSHEMRTPMNAIIGMTSIGAQADSIERKDYAFGKIEDASTHLLGVINDILDMSKIEANKLELSSVDFNFEKMLQKVVNVVNFKIEERGQIFHVNIDRRIPVSLIGDDQRLAQIITNLLSNATKFTPERGVISLDAQCLREGDEGVTLQIRVSDSGIGISAEQQAHLFSSFQQAESGTSRKFGGTGLGLAISKRIIALMGGEIWIESELGKGASFIFTVQMLVGEGSRHKQLAEGIDWKNLRILAVDDDEGIRIFFEDLAERYRIVCDVASSGEEALALVSEKGTYDIYFIDWKMPGMDGIELTRRVKEQGADTSVITIISSSEWSEIEAEAKAVGVDRYLTKPLFPSTIVELINELIGVERFLNVTDDREYIDDFTGFTVLLAEDVEVNQEIVLALLEPSGLVIDVASDGCEALRVFEADPQRYDIIFMDVQMPHMDGLEATRRIRALDEAYAHEVPIVAMTANVFREDIEKCLAAGMNDHVGKPIDLPEVLAKLRQYIKGGTD